MTISHKPVDSSLHPAWRDAAVHLISGVKWNNLLPVSAAEKSIAGVTNSTGYAIRQLAPDSGVYYNEVRPTLPSIRLLYTQDTILTLSSRPTLGSPTGSGHSGDQTIPGFFRSSKSMTRKTFCGAATVWEASHLCSTKTVLSAPSFELPRHSTGHGGSHGHANGNYALMVNILSLHQCA